MFKVIIDNKEVYTGTYWNCRGYTWCLYDNAIILDENNVQVFPE